VTARTILVTGGAGFIGSNLAVALAREPGTAVIAFDNLRRRGSELTVGRLHAAGVTFAHGDVRVATDLTAAVARADVVVECSAEPSVLAGRDGNPRYVIDTNLLGLVNCLELARRDGAALVFLSTSRIYPTALLSRLHYATRGQRFELLDAQPFPGVSAAGISEGFPLDGSRTLYGATKLAAELLIAEYVDMFGLRAIINRCGVVSGPWQMGHAEQGVFAYWLLAHLFERPLKYIGYGGQGHQVRDVLHVEDLAELIAIQIARPEALSGERFNVGGGLAISASLAELTDMCVRLTGTRVPIDQVAEVRAGDVPLYLSDSNAVRERFGWTPRRSLERILTDMHQWASAHRHLLRERLA
jgi:CDP-paratose 2-epimerase